MELDLDDQEPTVREYAQFHGLCNDYTCIQPQVNNLLAPSYEQVDLDFRDCSDPPLANLTDKLIIERLSIDREATLLLKWIVSSQEQPDITELVTETFKHMRGLKHDIPVLCVDYELDLLNFGNTAIPNFADLKIPLEVIHKENDEGLDWPSRYLTDSAPCIEQIEAEKPTVPKTSLLLLQEAIRDSYPQAYSDEIKTEGSSNKTHTKFEPLTPPLLPISPLLVPYIPSSPGNILELLSDEANSTAAEAKTLHDLIMEDDNLETHTSSDSDAMLLDIVEPQNLSPLTLTPILKRRGEDLKVEGPLTPPMFSESPTKRLKSVTFPQMLHEYIPELPSKYGSGNDVLEIDNSFVGFYKDLEPLSEEAKRSIDNEKLSEVDTTRRIGIPDVDVSLPVAPWDQFDHEGSSNHTVDKMKLDAQAKFILQIKRTLLKSSRPWHGSNELEGSLTWGPFPILAAQETVAQKLLERPQGEDDLGKILAPITSEDIATSFTDVWKRDGLRILDNEWEYEDDLKPSCSKDCENIDTLIKKRGPETREKAVEENAEHQTKIAEQFCNVDHPLHREVLESHHWNSAESTTRVTSRPSPKILESRKSRVQYPTSQAPAKQLPNDQDMGLMFGGQYSAAVAIEKFMQIHGKATQQPIANGSFLAIANGLSAPSTSPHTRSTKPILSESLTQDNLDQDRSWNQNLPPPSPLPKLPSVPRDLQQCSFIISSTLLRQRVLIKEVHKLFPEAILIDRDFDLPHSAAKEADIVLSPSTGLVITTLQQLKQRALPGQAERSLARERISALQSRYERLIVLVSEGLSREMEDLGTSRPVDPRNEQTIAQLEKFVSDMEGEVIMRYVRGGGVALSHVLVAEMATYGLPHGSKDMENVNILPDETFWELFLRRAGFNPFASQAIISSLKDPYELPLASSSVTAPKGLAKTVSVMGLPAFIMMAAEQRRERFQVLLGGTRILNRASALLDRKWPSAAHGFFGGL